MDYTFIIFAYAIGTLFGMYVGRKANTLKIVERTVDDLINRRYIKTKTVNDELELLQYDEE